MRGNKTITDSVTVTYDTTKPTATGLTVPQYTRTGKVTATAEGVTDNLSGVRGVYWYVTDTSMNYYMSAQASDTQWTKNIDMSSYAEGIYKVGFVIYDNAGNYSDTTYDTDSFIGWKTFIYDKTPPTAPRMEFVIGDWTRYTQGTWANRPVYAADLETARGPSGSTDALSGVAKYQISTDNSTWVDYSYDNTNSLYAMTTEGIHYRYFRAVDNAGNTSTPITRSAKIDLTAPTITGGEIKNVTKDGYDVYIYGVSDSLSGINRIQFPTWTNNTQPGFNTVQDDISVGGVAWTQLGPSSGTDLGGGTWKFRVNASDHNYEEGQYITHVYLYDNAGNNALRYGDNCYIDRTPPQIKEEIVTDGLIRNFDADNNTGTTHSNTATTWTNLAPGTDGLLTGGTWNSGGYLTLDGTDDWVNLGQVSLTNAATVETTIMPNTVGTAQYIISNQETGGLCIKLLASGKARFSVYVNGAYNHATSTTVLTAGTKYHIVGTYDGANMKLYINGVLEATKSVAGTIGAPKNNTVMAFGTNPQGSAATSPYANINIYDAKVYNRALTAEEVMENKYYTTNLVEEGLIRHYNAANNTGNGMNTGARRWTDLSGYKDTTGHNDGTVKGVTWGEKNGTPYASFAGTNDSYVNLGGMFFTNALTLEATIEIPAIQSGWAMILSNQESGGVALGLYNGKPVIQPHINGSYVTAVSDTALTPNTKYHLAGTYDGTTVKIYVDGVLKNSETKSGSVGIQQSSTVMIVGGGASGSLPANENFAGKIYNTRIYNKALTQAQIQQNMNFENNSKTWKKSQTITGALTDNYSGIKSGADINYGWSTSSTTAPSYSASGITYTQGATKAPYTMTNNTGTGKYFLWMNPVSPDYETDVHTNVNKNKMVSMQRVYVDNTAPAVTLSVQKNETWAKKHTITVTLSDAHSGLATGTSIRYGWSTSTTTPPSEYANATIGEYYDGAKSTRFTATTENLLTESADSGKYYLWIEPQTYNDVAGNSKTEIVKSTGTFWIDLTAPYWKVENFDVDETNKVVTADLVGADDHSGYKTDSLSSDDIQVYVDNTLLPNVVKQLDTTSTDGKYKLTLTNFEEALRQSGKSFKEWSGALSIEVPSYTLEDKAGDQLGENGYKMLSYIEATGTQYIDTGVTVKSTLVSQLKFNMTEATGYVIYGNISGSDTEDYRLFNASSKCYLDFPGEKRIYGGTMSANVDYEVEVGNYYVKDLTTGENIISGSPVTFSEQADTMKMWIGEYNGNTFYSSGKLYYLKIYDNGTLVRDFIPCMSPSGEIGLYDKVNGVFYANAGTGTFGAGTLDGEEIYGNRNTENTVTLGHTDVIEPEFTYKYSETSTIIGHGNGTTNGDQKVTVIFDVVDKYFSGKTLTANDITITVIDENKTVDPTKITKTLTKVQDVTETVNGTSKKIGERLQLVIEGLDEGTGFDYSGTMSLTFPSGKISDTSGNTNHAQTITIGIDSTNDGVPTSTTTKPYLPEGYNHVEGNLNTGIVIADKNGNQYVWVEVPKTSTVYSTAGLDIYEFTDAEYTKIENDLKTYTSVYRNGTTYTDTWYSQEATGLTEEQYNTQKKKMLKSIYKNGGFYVGRYETGIDYNDANGHRTAAGEITQTPVIKQNAYPYNYVTSAQAQELSERFASSGYTSSLMFGVQWDLILKYLESKGATQEELITDSTAWGNHSTNLYNITNSNSRYSNRPGHEWINEACGQKTTAGSLVLSTGASDVFNKQNIYDLAGNEWEWTLEYTSNPEKAISMRGGEYGYSGNPRSASHRGSHAVGGQLYGSRGFRTALYKDEGTGADIAVTPPYIPDGYSVVDGTSLQNGFVVEDSSGNQFVWIEVPRTTTVYPTAGVNIKNFEDSATITKIENDLKTYTTVYRQENYTDTNNTATGLTDAQYNTLKNSALVSIYKNGGFYVGRYETGIDYSEGARTATGETTQTPVIKQNAYPYNYVTAAQAQELSGQFASTGYTSSLMFGVQWDLIMKYLETKGTSVEELTTNSMGWGNYYNSLWSITNTSAKYSGDGLGAIWADAPWNKPSGGWIFLTTGASERFSKQNIYELAGNLMEYTLEYTSIADEPCSVRGGDAGCDDYQPASSRWYRATDFANSFNGFRVMLFANDKETPIVDVVKPVWKAENVSATTDPTTGKTSAHVELTGSDKYFKTCSINSVNDIKVMIGVDDVTSQLDVSLTGPEQTADSVKYVFSLSNFEEDYDEFIAERTKYLANPSTGRLYREFSGPVDVVIPAGTVVDESGNISDELTVPLGDIDTLKPEVVKVGSATIDKSAGTATIVFDITDKYMQSSAITTTDTSKIHVLVDGTERTEITKTITNIEELKATINGNSNHIVGYRYTVQLSNFRESETSAAYGDYSNWSGNVALKIDAGAATDKYGTSNSATTLETDMVDFIKPDVTYIYATSDINKTNKTFKMVFEITDKYFANSTLTKDNLIIKLVDESNRDITSQVTTALDIANITYGKRYTLTISDLDKLVINEDKGYVDFSGVISVGIPAGVATDSNGNSNNATTITSGINQEGSVDVSGSQQIVDVVSPLVEKVSATASAINPVDKTSSTATITVKASDKYNIATADLSGKVKVLAHQKDATAGTYTDITSSVTFSYGTASITDNVAQQAVTIKGFPQDANQIKVEIQPGAFTDINGNTNIPTQLIVYNVLKSAASEEAATSGFLGGTIARQDIHQIIFTNSLSGATGTIWDVSAVQDGSIKAWTSQNSAPYTVYIGSDDEMFGNRDSQKLFNYIGYASNATATETIKDLELLNVTGVTSMMQMFRYCGYDAMTKLDLGANFDTSNVTNMNAMFAYCGHNAMTKLDLRNSVSESGATVAIKFDTSNVSNMEAMFSYCGYTAMTAIDFGDEFNTSNVTIMKDMFSNCGFTAMQTLNLGAEGITFNTAKVTNMWQMFYRCGYTAMHTLDLGDLFDTSLVTDMHNMFRECGYKELLTLDLSSGTSATNTKQFNTSNVSDMVQVFQMCGVESMTTLNLGHNFDTSKATNMQGMFMDTGKEVLTSLDLGDKFYTTKATNMQWMFTNTGATLMTTLDLGPVFTKISSSNTSIFENTGKAGACTIYAPEAIYSSSTAFKLGSNSATTITYANGTINPRYRTEWIKESATVSGSSIVITLRGRTLPTDGTYQYASSVVSSMPTGTLSGTNANKIKVYIDGTELTGLTKVVGTATASGNDVLQTVTLSGFEETDTSWLGSGRDFRQWSGNITLEVAKGTLYDKYGSYKNDTTPVLNVAQDVSGNYVSNGNLASTISTAITNKNQSGYIFVDTIKPEVRYKSSETTIDYTGKKVNIIFTITDKYFNNSTLTVNDLIISIGGETPTWATDAEITAGTTKPIRKFSNVTDIKATVDGTANTVVGKQYTLELSNLDQGLGFDYSGIVTVQVPAGKVTDNSGNANNLQIITVGVDLPGGSGSGDIVDVVDPIWRAENVEKTLDITTGAMTTTLDLIGEDKYYIENTLTNTQLKILKGEVEQSMTITLGTATETATGVKYPVTITGTSAIGDQLILRVPQGTVSDEHNANEVTNIPLDFSAVGIGLLVMKEGSLTGTDYINNTLTKQDIYVYANENVNGNTTTTYTVTKYDGATTTTVVTNKPSGSANNTKLTGSGTYTISLTSTNSATGENTTLIYKARIDQGIPTIEVSPENTTGSTYASSNYYVKSLSTTITVTEPVVNGISSGLATTNSYNWFLSTSTAPTAVSTTPGTYGTYRSGIAFTMGEELNGEYYLFVKQVSDKVGNVSTTGGTIVTVGGEKYHRYGLYKFDNTLPTITLSAQKNEDWKQKHEVTVTLADAHSGLATGASVKYGWSTSTSTEPSSYATASISAYSAGAASATFTATTAGLITTSAQTNKYYLWVKTETYSDAVGNSNVTTVKSTGTFWVDLTKPTVTLSENSNSTWKKTHSVTVTLADAHAGLKTGASIKYGWSLSNTTPPANADLQTASISTIPDNANSANSATFTANKPANTLTGEYYLWIIPTTLQDTSEKSTTDATGNAYTTNLVSTGKFKFDNTLPTVTLSAQKNETWSKKHEVTVTLADAHSGLAAGASVKYGWSTSTTTPPSSYANATISTYSAGAGSATFKATTEGLITTSAQTNKYYLWIEPQTYKDVATNSNTTTVKSTGTFWIDLTNPYWETSNFDVDEANNKATVTITGKDDHSGYKTDTLDITDITVEVDNTVVSGIEKQLTGTNGTYTLTLTKFEEQVRQSGKSYKEWSGAVSITIIANTLEDKAGELYSTAGNKNTAKEFDIGHADVIEPEFTYKYADTTVNHTNKTLTVIFDVTDKFFSTSDIISKKDQIIVKLLDENKTIPTANITRTLTKVQDVTATVNGASKKIGERYRLVIGGLEEVDANGYSDGTTYSGPMSITFPANAVTDTSSNKNVATTITIGIDEKDGDITDGGDGGTQEIVDVVDPVWNTEGTPTVTTDASGITSANATLVVTDKYLNQSTLSGLKVEVDGDDKTSELDITIGTQQETTKTITAIDGTEQTLPAHQYTFSLTNFEETYAEFLAKREDYANGVAGGRLYREFSGPVEIVVPKGAAKDNDNNDSEEKRVSLGTIDTLKPEVILVNPDADSVANKQTIIFDITDKYITSSTINGTALNADGTINNLANVNTSNIHVLIDNDEATGVTKTIKNIETLRATINGNSNHIVGYRYTLELSGFEQATLNAKGYKDYSGTVSIKIDTNTAKDSSGTGNAETTLVGNFIDVIKPVIEKVSSENLTGGKQKIVFKATDKYMIETDMIQQSELTVKVDGETATGLIESFTSAPIEATFNKTISGAVASGNYTIGHTYTLILSGFEQASPNAKGYKDWSGTVTVDLTAGTVKDTTNNLSDAKTIDGVFIDVIKPLIEKVSSRNLTGGKQEIIFRATDKYMNTSDLITQGELTVYVDGETVTGLIESFTQAPINATFNKTVSGAVTSGTYTIGHTYTLVLSGFEQTTRNAKDYKDWSGTVSIDIDLGAVKDSSNNLSDLKTIKGEFIDIIKPDLKYTHQTTDIDKTNKKYTMTFSVTDKYFASQELTLDDITIKMQNGQVDASGNLIVDDLKTKNVTIRFQTPEEIRKNDVKVTTNVENGTVEEKDNYLIGYSYTIIIEHLEQLEIAPGESTLDYSGIISVEIPSAQVTDTTGNTNNQTTITSGVNIPGGTGSGEEVDVVAPLWEKVSSSAYAVGKTASITIRGTDTYFDTSNTDAKTLSSDEIELYINGTKNTSIIPSISTATPKSETRIVNGVETTVQYGVEYTISLTGFAQNVNQVKIRILANAITDQSGNGNVVTDMMIYNVLRTTNTETDRDSVFLGGTIERQKVESVSFKTLTHLEMTTWAEEVGTDNSYWDVSAQRDKSIVAHYTDTDSNGAYEVVIGSHWEIFANQDSSYLFSYIGYSADCDATATVTGIELLNEESVTNMSYMFNNFGYRKMTTLNLGEFKTTNVTDMSGMFNNCGNLAMTSLNIGSQFNTSNVTDMSNMFNGCGQSVMTNLYFGTTTGIASGVITLPDNFNTAKVQNMSGMFQSFGAGKIKTLNLGNTFYTSEVTDMSNMFNGCGQSELTTFSLGANFNTVKVQNMSGMFKNFAHKLNTLTLGGSFNTSAVTDMSGMFQDMAKSSTVMTSLDLGDLFYTTSATDMSNMFNGCGLTAMTALDLGPRFTKIASTNTGFATNTGKSGSVIYAPESIYSSRTAFKKATTDTSTTIAYSNGTINPIYKPKWEVTGTTRNVGAGTVAITVKGSAYETNTSLGIDAATGITINYADNVTSTLSTGEVSVFMKNATGTWVDITTLVTPTVATGTSSTNETSGKTEITHVITLSNLDDVTRLTGLPYNEWAGNIKLKIHGRGQATSTYSANILKDNTFGNQNMMEIDSTGTWVNVTQGNEFVDYIKPEFRYESANTTIQGLPDSAGTADATKTVTVLFDVLDKYFANSTLAVTDITLKVISPTPVETLDPTKFTKTLEVKTIATETTNATSGLTYKTNGDIYYDIDGDGTKEKVGQRYELVISNLDQGNGVDYSGPMSITFPAGKVSDKGPKGDNNSPNTNNQTTITIGVDETDGNPITPDGGTQKVIDMVNPVWETVGTPTVTTDANGVTSANATILTYDKYLTTSALREFLKVEVAGEDKTDELDITISEPTETTKTVTTVDGNTETVPAHRYTFTLKNFEETLAEYLTVRESGGRLYREFSGPVKVVIPKGASVDSEGNDSEEFTINLGTIDTLKPEVVKVKSSVDKTAKTQTVIFDITDKYLVSSAINGTALNADGTINNLANVDTSKLHVLVDGVEATYVTKQITNIEKKEATINGSTKTIGYRYTLLLSGFEEPRASAVYGEYTNWAGTVTIKVDANTAVDASGTGNAETILPGDHVDNNVQQSDYVDYVKPNVTYKYAESSQAVPGDINYSGKTFKMVFDITDKYFDEANSTILTKDDLKILIDGELPGDTNGNGVLDNGETSPITITLPNPTEVKKTFKKTVGGVVTNAEHLIGHRYTLTLSNLEQLQIKDGDYYLDYSGVITVTVPAGVAKDVTVSGKNASGGTVTIGGNTNDQTVITSGFEIAGGIIDNTSQIVDVVDPLVEKLSTSAYGVGKTSTIRLRATDKYLKAEDALADAEVQVLVNGSVVTTGITKTIGNATYKKIDASGNLVTTANAAEAIAVEYEITVTGYESSANQVKVRILEDAITDDSGNGNKSTDLILYNVLRTTNTETAQTSVFLGGTIQRQKVEKVMFKNLTYEEQTTWTGKVGTDNSYWDVSAQRDKSIVAHYTDTDSNGAYEVTIGSHWEIFANQDSSYLFSYIGYSADCDDTATITLADISLLNEESVTNMSYMFNHFGYRKMQELDLGIFKTSNVTDMSGMFNNCGNLAMTSMNIGSEFNTSSVTNMSNMFNGCGQSVMTNLYFGTTTGIASGVITLPDNFNTAQVTNMSAMFQNFGAGSGATGGVKSLNLGNSFYINSNLKDMSNMFNGCGQTEMTTFSLGGNFNTENVENMSGMFQNFGHKVENLTLGTKFDTKNVTDMSNMFNGCGQTGMKTLTLGSKFNTIKVQKMNAMFQNCGQNELTSLDLGDLFYTTVATDMSNMFNGCGKIKMTVLDLGPAFTKISNTHTDIFKDCGTSALIVYAPESIYESKVSFK